MKRAVALAVTGAAMGAAGAATALRSLLRQALPEVEGRRRLAGLEAEVEVIRDRFGVPHIYGRTRLDVARAQGYVHAQDRLFQMDVVRRLGSGRLSELAGARAIELDRAARRLRLRWAAERDVDGLDRGMQELAAAYCGGVNAFLADGRLPVECRLARTRPAPWSPVDVQLFEKLFDLALSINWESELARLRIAARVGAERARRLDPSYPADGPVIVPVQVAGEAVAPGAARLRRLLGRGASNSWVVAGSRTASGTPLLANDPHLSLTIPGVWHVQHLSWEGGNAAGFTVPGAPGIVLGRNERVAWGATAAQVDTQDLYVERFSLDDPFRYEADGAWLEAEVVREEIRVRGRRQPVVEEVVVTRHGPVVAELESGGREALALRWSAYERGATGRALEELMIASRLDEAERALDGYAGPPLNFVLADADGAIGYRLAGGPIPLREPGEGLLPAPGWDSASEWRGFVPPDELPRLRDPERGFIVTANNRIVDHDYPRFLGAEWLNGYRAQRIEELLAGLEAVTPGDCERIQRDLVSLPGRRMAEIARGFSSGDLLEQRALGLLVAWDGEYGPASAAGAVYGALMRKLQEEAYSELGDELPHFLGAGRSELAAALGLFERTRPVILEALAARDDSFFADGRTWEGVFRGALSAAVVELRERLGDDPDRWRWGDLHALLFQHPFGELPIVGRFLNRGPFPVGGDTDTVWQMAWRVERPYGPHLSGPSMRAVYDLGDIDATWLVLPTGQSGHPSSPHYDDFVERWLEGGTVQLVMSRGRVEELAEAHLVLAPATTAPGGGKASSAAATPRQGE